MSMDENEVRALYHQILDGSNVLASITFQAVKGPDHELTFVKLGPDAPTSAVIQPQRIEVKASSYELALVKLTEQLELAAVPLVASVKQAKQVFFVCLRQALCEPLEGDGKMLRIWGAWAVVEDDGTVRAV